jgi:hypothetical protein
VLLWRPGGLIALVVVKEQVQHGRSALIEAGRESSPFFREGWEGNAGAQENATFRMNSIEAWLPLPVPVGMGARVVLRRVPGEDSSAAVGVWVGEERLSNFVESEAQGDRVSVHISPAHA